MTATNDSEVPEPSDLSPTRKTPEIPVPPESRGPQPPAAPTAPPAPAGRRWLAPAGVVLAVVVLGGVGAWVYWARGGAAPGSSTSQPAPEAAPPELRPYLDQARNGDAKAMHMIALMYWNGLNVRQDRVKGLEWYKKAAAAGSTAAQQFLKDNGLQ